MSETNSKLVIKGTNVFERNWQAFHSPDIKYIKNEGGSRSSKTYSICQLLIFYAIENPDKIISVIRKHGKTVKDTVMKQDFIPMMKSLGLWDQNSFNKTDSVYTFDNGTVIEFYGADDENKLRGRKRDIAWLNEATELLWDDFKQIAMRTGSTNTQGDDSEMESSSGKIIIDYNPSAPTSFLYNLPEDKTIQIHSTYHDNPFLDKGQIDFIEDLKNNDPTGYQVFALGLRGVAKENVYPLWDRLKSKPTHLKNYIYGLDFGFNHPTTLVKIWYDTDSMDVYLEEDIYSDKLTSGDLIVEMNRIGVDKNISIIADYARPEIISDLRREGFTILNADKSVEAGINAVRQFNISISHDALNIKKENELYKYKKSGDIITDDVIKKYDDCMDAIRYGLYYIKKTECGGDDLGVYTFSMS